MSVFILMLCSPFYMSRIKETNERGNNPVFPQLEVFGNLQQCRGNKITVTLIPYFQQLLEWRATSWAQRRRWWRGFWMLQPEETYPSWPCCWHIPRHSSTRRVTVAGQHWCSLLAMDTAVLWRHCCLMGRISSFSNQQRLWQDHILDKASIRI